MRYRRSDVVERALTVLDTWGLADLTMRRLGAELGVQPSALYHHVPNKQALLALMAEEILASVELGSIDPAAICRSLRRALLGIRDGADVVAAAAAFRVDASGIESRLAELVGADGARTLLLHAFGHAQWTQTQLDGGEYGLIADVPSSTELDAAYARGVQVILAGARLTA